MTPVLARAATLLATVERLPVMNRTAQGLKDLVTLMAERERQAFEVWWHPLPSFSRGDGEETHEYCPKCLCTLTFVEVSAMQPEDVEVYHWGQGKWIPLAKNPWLSYLEARRCDYRRAYALTESPPGEAYR